MFCFNSLRRSIGGWSEAESRSRKKEKTFFFFKFCFSNKCLFLSPNVILQFSSLSDLWYIVSLYFETNNKWLNFLEKEIVWWVKTYYYFGGRKLILFFFCVCVCKYLFFFINRIIRLESEVFCGWACDVDRCHTPQQYNIRDWRGADEDYTSRRTLAQRKEKINERRRRRKKKRLFQAGEQW